jgi:serine protease Do
MIGFNQEKGLLRMWCSTRWVPAALAVLLLISCPALAQDATQDTTQDSTPAQNPSGTPAVAGNPATAGAAGPAIAVPPSREAVRQSFAPIVKLASPAVVNVYSHQVVKNQSPLLNDPILRHLFAPELQRLGLPRDRVLNSLGSGVIVDSSGLIVTNFHVIRDAEDVTVVLSDRREFDAKILLTDEREDLAVLKINVPNERLPVLELADSDKLEVGDMVLAIGNPFGVGQTVTSGIISGLARTGIGLSDFGSYIQTDAAINPGNSGGALVDIDGKMVGINTAIFSENGGSIGIGFAIPSVLVKPMIDAAEHGRQIEHPWLGIMGEDVTSDAASKLGLPRPAGVLVKDVSPGGPAAKAGIQSGDVILSVAGHDIDDAESLRFRLATLGTGSPATLTLWRNGKPRDATAMLTTPPDSPTRDVIEIADASPMAGATVGNLNPAFNEELNFKPGQTGVVVIAVKPGSPSEQLGLQADDLIIGANHKKVENVAQLRKALGTGTAPWSFVIRRGDKIFTATPK